MWFSTIWGVYNFSGMILASLAVVVLLCIQLSATPGRPLYGVFTVEHLHDLGKLLAGFSCFWMYIWFSQYMLIWYSNIPEETSYFIIRMRGAWSPIVAVSIVLNWLIPFFVLLPKPSKRSPSIMSKVACILLLGRWVDLYVMVLPTTTDRGPHFGIWELSGILAIAAIGTLTLTTSFSKAPAVDTTAPYLSESLHYHA